MYGNSYHSIENIQLNESINTETLIRTKEVVIEMAENSIARDLLILADENNPATSEKTIVRPNTTLDQVYDQLSPDYKTLREILEDLREEIISGGIGVIVFPVNSVNGKTGDVQITAEDVGLGNVDNTADVDKPLSEPQHDAIMGILNNFEFDVDLSDLYNHINNHDNPHGVTLDQIDVNHQLEKNMENLIKRHNYSNLHTTHADIRQGIAGLWRSMEAFDTKLSTTSELLMSTLGKHIEDPYAHYDILQAKENRDNKVHSIVEQQDTEYYPSANAVVDYVKYALDKYKRENPTVTQYIEDVYVVDSRDFLPDPSPTVANILYLIRYGIGSYSELARCIRIKNQYDWNFSILASYSKFDDDYFHDSIQGLTINIDNIIDVMMGQQSFLDHVNGLIRELVPENLGDQYYTKDEIDNKTYLRDITIIPGTQHGTLRFYINHNPMTMSDDVRVAGLQRLAFMEFINSDQIYENAIRTRHIAKKNVTPDLMTTGYQTVLGNLTDTNGTCSEISIKDLADALIPFLQGRV